MDSSNFFKNEIEKFFDNVGEKNPISVKDMRAAILKINKHFKDDNLCKKFVASNYLEKDKLRQAYIQYYAIINAYKTFHILNSDYQLEKNIDSFRVLDIGAGPGSCTIGFLLYLKYQGIKIKNLKILAVDYSVKALKDFKEIIGYFISDQDNVELKTVKKDLRKGLDFKPNDSFDLALVGNVLNELLIKPVNIKLDTWDSLLIIEPAKGQNFIGLSKIRDIILKTNETFSVVSPCSHNFDCPLAETKDWCFRVIPFSLPPQINELDRIVKLDHKNLNFCYLFVRKEPKVNKIFYNVVGTGKIRHKVYSFKLCGQGKIINLKLRKSEVSDKNKVIIKAKMGTRLCFVGAEKSGEDLILKKGSEVEVI